MKKFNFLLLFMIFNQLATSQSCLPDGIKFTSQAQIDNFQSNYPGCTRIEGDVIIGSEAATNITNLNGLNVLTYIGGSLSIGGNPNLLNFSGLDNLIFIGGDLKTYYQGVYALYWNESLQSFAGLESLDTIGGNLSIAYNPKLDDLTALSGIESFNKYLSIFDNDSLINLAGLEFIDSLDFLQITLNSSLINLAGLDSLSFVNNMVSISENNSLASLSGLEKLSFIGDDLSVSSNPVLADLDGLTALSSVGGDLRILSNSSLLSLSGLNNLATVGGEFWIYGNPELISLMGSGNLVSIGSNLRIGENNSLTSLKGLDNITTCNLDYLSILGNDLLSVCEVHCICDYLIHGTGFFTIDKNATGCNSSDEVLEKCLYGTEEISLPGQICKVFPNPGSKAINFSISIEESSDVRIEIINSKGEIVQILLDEKMQEGYYNLRYSIADMQDGIYFYRLISDYETATGKLILIK
jgi:hypothetical protein